MKRVLDVGQCPADHGAICRLITSSFDAEVLEAHDARETIALLHRDPFDLVLVNRKLDVDFSDGLDIIKQIRSDPLLVQIPVMLLTNYPEHQRDAIAAGAVQGFGKAEYRKPETLSRLREFLG